MDLEVLAARGVGGDEGPRALAHVVLDDHVGRRAELARELDRVASAQLEVPGLGDAAAEWIDVAELGRHGARKAMRVRPCGSNRVARARSSAPRRHAHDAAARPPRRHRHAPRALGGDPARRRLARQRRGRPAAGRGPAHRRGLRGRRRARGRALLGWDRRRLVARAGRRRLGSSTDLVARVGKGDRRRRPTAGASAPPSSPPTPSTRSSSSSAWSSTARPAGCAGRAALQGLRDPGRRRARGRGRARARRGRAPRPRAGHRGRPRAAAALDRHAAPRRRRHVAAHRARARGPPRTACRPSSPPSSRRSTPAGAGWTRSARRVRRRARRPRRAALRAGHPANGLAYALFLPDGERPGRRRHAPRRRLAEGEPVRRGPRPARRRRGGGLLRPARARRERGRARGRRARRRRRPSATLLPPGPRALRGSSMGGFMALMASTRMELAAVVAVCPASSELLARGLRDGPLLLPRRPRRPAPPAGRGRRAGGGARRSASGCCSCTPRATSRCRSRVSRALHAGAPGSRLVAVPGGHHRSIQHDPELTAVAVRFLTRALRPRPAAG